MKGSDAPDGCGIVPEMTILEIVERHPQTEAVFNRYDGQAGVCLCCQALFEPLGETAVKYGLNLEMFLDDLNAVAK